MIGWKRDYYIFEWRVLTFEGAAADLSISTTSVVTTSTASLRKLQHRWDNKGVWFSDGDGTILLRRNMEVFENLEAAKLHFNGMTPILKQQDRDITGLPTPFIYGWMRPGPAKERAVMSLAVGPYS